jgi:hypothetical protein
VASLAVRTGLVALAVLVLAWLFVGLRAVRLEDQAEAVLDRARAGPVSDADVRRASRKLQQADDFSPDQGPMIKYGQLLQAVGKDRPAGLIAHAVTVDEPDNLTAWFLAWSTDSNPSSKREALNELRRLNPYIDVALRLRDCPDCPLLKKR